MESAEIEKPVRKLVPPPPAAAFANPRPPQRLKPTAASPKAAPTAAKTPPAWMGQMRPATAVEAPRRQGGASAAAVGPAVPPPKGLIGCGGSSFAAEQERQAREVAAAEKQLRRQAEEAAAAASQERRRQADKATPVGLEVGIEAQAWALQQMEGGSLQLSSAALELMRG